ncbi:BTAD domain-containing putative transcriptional regulator [Nonomuraea africana]|uniref:DNA-binding NarL/FixJ family response regulator/DNA-binding SARP family transcriptional activator n=1 Tax=Nonomuraea africana TaxID=46171 RepID=A0ABR9KIQ8_9ACTN|nr:BTAD domain-containing putative transcriptional regulator [Nonomuraea africana]MBE1561690.1 DNA-binding NarL/FixJ family response regulator/DNA-binding SARP family transcriptional activator [Nonomuraea africana]
MVTFSALGPFQVCLDGLPLDLGGQRQMAVLARLLVARGRAVPVTILIDDLWPGGPPAQALSTIQGYVSRLRRALEPDRAPRSEAGVLVSAPPGYALRATTDQVACWRFEQLARTEGPAAAVWTSMEAALALWRGPALAEFADLAWASTEAGRLEELRLVAIERRAEAGLRLGRSAALVPDLEAHASAHPLREEGWRLLATALYRSGRQGDALGALRRARTIWREELGLDPSGLLQRLEADMLSQSPHLDLPPVEGPPSGGWSGAGAAGGPGASDDESGGAARALRVVVADDQALVRTGLRVVIDTEPGLELAGEAADGEQAIGVVRDTRPDLVLLDIQMPRLDGLTAARRILADEEPPKVIMMTTFGTDENLYAALRAGVSGFVLKTSAPEQLVAAMRAAAAGDALIDPALTTRIISAFAGTPDPAAPPALAGLADPQLDVLRLIARGLTNRQIARTLAVPDRQVADTVAGLLDHLGLFDRAQLVVAAYETGLVTPGDNT